jgi:hypothetical protein
MHASRRADARSGASSRLGLDENRDNWKKVTPSARLTSEVARGRPVVGFSMGARMTRTLEIDALRMAWFRGRPKRGGSPIRNAPANRQERTSRVIGLPQQKKRNDQNNCFLEQRRF